MWRPLRQLEAAAPTPGRRASSPRSRARRWLWAAGVLLALGVPPLASAQERPPPEKSAPLAQKVGIEVMVVHATNAHETVDGRLRPLMQHLRFLNYTGFDVLDTNTESLGIDQEASFEIVGGREVKVQLLERDDEAAKIRVRMFNSNGKLLDTTVSIHRNRSFMVAGPRHDGGVLILPVTARY